MKKYIDLPRFCTKNNETKQRKVADEYVRLCGYKHGEIGKNHSQKCQNGISEKLTLSQIAAQLGTSKRDLQRALRIERNLTESMKELLDNGVITKTLAADVIASLMTKYLLVELLRRTRSGS